MKGIAHFAVGVGVASCFPQAVRAGAAGNPVYFLLGGVFGLLPDTLDFKLFRFLARHDIEVVPDPNRPDEQMIADAVACAVDGAGDSNKPVVLKLNTIRLGPDRWQSYSVKFDVPGRRVAAQYGPVVTTGQVPCVADTVPGSPAHAPLAFPVALDYEAETLVDIFEGPSFRMTPRGDGKVCPVFLPWHREWSHGLLAALAAGTGAGLLWGPLAGLVAGLALASHVVVDQLGFMGSNLWFPWARTRTPGRGMVRSGSGSGNLLAVWLSCLLIFWNLYRQAGNCPVGLTPLDIVTYGGLIPLGAFVLAEKALAVSRGDRR